MTNIIADLKLIDALGYHPVITYHEVDYFLGSRRLTKKQVCRSYFLFQKDLGGETVSNEEYDLLGSILKTL